MTKANLDIREAAKSAGVCFWEIAKELGMQDSGFSRKLRRELPQEEKDRILDAISRITGTSQKCGPVKTSDLGKEIIQRRRELAEKTIHRINCCIENRCNDCDLNKRFDDGVCYDSVMAEAKSLLYAAYVLNVEI